MNKKNLSKYDLEHRRLYAWCKHSRKQMNTGELKPERVEAFKNLMEKNKHVNQYQ